LAATVVAVNVKEGQAVKEGDLLVTLEAMKMSTPINSDRAGTVSKIYVSAGQSVQEGQPLIAIA
jgi:biotin carboxyl carrier protein